MMGIRNGVIAFAFLFGFFAGKVFGADGGGGGSASTECTDDFQKVLICLDYAKGKSTTPSKECCTAVKGIRDSKPKCLCYVIQQAHSGNDALKNLGVQEAKLLQLPSACQLQNASVSDCPKLLGLSPSSPDAAIFSNTSTSATPAAPVATGTSASPDKADGSAATVNGRFLVGPTLIVAMAIFFYAFPTGSASICV